MGSTVSICNKTSCVLNMAMKHLTPLYYENAVAPDECIHREVGKVWFTIEARLWNGDNGYDTLEDIVYPITLLSLAALTAAAGGVLATSVLGSVAGVATVAGKVFTIGKVILTVGATDVSRKIIQGWVSDHALRVHGLYMGSPRNFDVVGGPNCSFFNGFQVVKYGTGDEFALEYY